MDRLTNAQCPLWIRSGHSALASPMAALRQKRTSVVVAALETPYHPRLETSRYGDHFQRSTRRHRRANLANTVAYRYRIYDASEDEYRYSTRLATKEQIERIGGEIVGR